MSSVKRNQRGSSKLIVAVVLVLVVAIVAIVIWRSSSGGTSEETGGVATSSEVLQIGFITVGPVSDWGYNYQHNEGRLELERVLGSEVLTVLAENVPESADAERVAQRMINDGAELVFMTSYGYGSSSMRVAGRNPDIKFMQALGTESAENLGTYAIKVWEGAYISGIVAASSLPGEMRFGFVGAHPVPPIHWTVNAFALGAQSVTPDATVNIVFTNSWYSPTEETEAVNSLVDSGVQAVYILTDSPIAGVQAAERRGIHSLAHFADMTTFAPTGWLTGTIWNWGPLYVDVARSVLDGTWTNQPVGGGVAQDYVAVAPFGPDVTQAARDKAAAAIAELRAGGQVFRGPIYDSAGVLRVPEGTSMSVPEIQAFDWVVRGVRGAS